jgi:hypothetical protein
MKQWKRIALALVMCAGLSGAAWAQPQAWGHQDRPSNYRRDAGRERNRQDYDRGRGDRDDRDRDHRSDGYYSQNRARGYPYGRNGNYNYPNYGW